MTFYQVTIENRVYQVNVSDDRSTVDGQEVDARVLSLNRNGLHLIRRGQQALELFLSTLDDETYQMVMRGGRRIVTRISSHLRSHARTAAEESRDYLLSAPMPGLVVEVKVSQGDEVEADRTLVVLESMKMQMQLRSRMSGRIEQVNVRPGDQVEKGAVLVQFEQAVPKEENHE